MNKRRNLVISILAIISLITVFSPIAFAQNTVDVVEIEDTTEIEPRDFILEWRYKVIGDHLYKRLFNRTTGQWETDWILVQ